VARQEDSPLAPLFARESATSFMGIPACAGTQPRVTGVMVRRLVRDSRTSLTSDLLALVLIVASAAPMVYLLSIKTKRGRRGNCGFWSSWFLICTHRRRSAESSATLFVATPRYWEA
jgi:hypothetical protein